MILPISAMELASDLSARVTKQMLVVAGNCTAEFDGRIKSHLDWGDRILIVKPDESIILHGPAGIKPLNWQLPGEGRVNFLEENEILILRTYRPRTAEHFEIRFREVYNAWTYDATDLAQMKISGDESHFSQYLSRHLDLVEPGLDLMFLEFNTPHGYIDILCRDQEGKHLVIELKKQNATLSDAHQLERYRDFFLNKESRIVRAMLIAPSFSMRVKQYLSKRGLEAKEFSWQDVFPTLPEFQHPTLDDFLYKD